MLNLLQLLDKFVLALIFWLVCFSSFSSGVELGISPPILVFNGNVGEKICSEYKILSDRKNISLILSDRWINEKELIKNIELYNLDGKVLGIEAVYDKKILINNKHNGEVCLRAKNGGSYYGVLIFSSENGNVGVGSWIIVNISKFEDIEDKGFITGRVIKDNNIKNFRSRILGALLILTTILLAGLFILIRKHLYRRITKK